MCFTTQIQLLRRRKRHSNSFFDRKIFPHYHKETEEVQACDQMYPPLIPVFAIH